MGKKKLDWQQSKTMKTKIMNTATTDKKKTGFHLQLFEHCKFYFSFQLIFQLTPFQGKKLFAQILIKES